MFDDAPVSCLACQDDALYSETETFSLGPNEMLPPARISISAVHSN